METNYNIKLGEINTTEAQELRLGKATDREYELEIKACVGIH